MFPSRPPRFLVNHKVLLFRLERRSDANRWLEATSIKSGDPFVQVRPVSGDEMISVITETVDQKSNGLSRPVKRAQRVFGTIRLQRNWLWRFQGRRPSTVNLRNGVD
jgi:hypothetical protein